MGGGLVLVLVRVRSRRHGVGGKGQPTPPRTSTRPPHPHPSSPCPYRTRTPPPPFPHSVGKFHQEARPKDHQGIPHPGNITGQGRPLPLSWPRYYPSEYPRRI